MKKSFLTILISLFSFSAWSGITVVSDLDDTIKITNSGDEIDGAVNAAFRSDVFVGISELWMGMESYTNEKHILSASPTVLRLKIQTTLKKRQISYDSIILKNPLINEDKLTYKIRMIEEIMKTNTDDFIFLGDDVGMDPEVYDYFVKKYPHKVLSVYIRPVKNRKIPDSAKIYYTNFDIALSEYEQGRMSASWVETVADRLVETTKLTHVIPEFAHCPEDETHWSSQYKSDYAEVAKFIATKIVEYCQNRKTE